MSRLPLRLLTEGGVTRRLLLGFTLISAVINGIVTAGVGSWLAQKYSLAETRRQSITSIAALFYDRRTKAGLVVSSLRRGADLDEVRHRKRSYDEAYVDWNKNIRQNLFAIREVMGDSDLTVLEQDFESHVVARLSTIDACLTKAYDERLKGSDPVVVLEGCRMAQVYQQTLDCGASFTNELYKITRVSFVPFARVSEQLKSEGRARILKACMSQPVP